MRIHIKTITFIFILAALFYPGSYLGTVSQAPARKLESYLVNSTSSIETTVLEIVQAAQIISLEYEQNRPTDSESKNARFTRSLRASHVTPIAHHKNGKIYPRISAVFSKLYGDAKRLEPHNWLEEMKKPLAVGYQLTSVSVILTPSEETKKESLKISQAVARAVSQKLNKMSSRYQQLHSFSVSECLYLGGWKYSRLPNWPSYPYVMYNQSSGYDDQKRIRRDSEDWCMLSFNIRPITGNPSAMACSGTQTYPMQGIYAVWYLHSGNKEFNKTVSESIRGLLKPLSDLETELKKKPMEAQQRAASHAATQRP